MAAHGEAFIFKLMNFRPARKNHPMKHIPSIVLAVALAIPAFAQETKTNATAEVPAPGQMFPASAAVLTAPLVLTNDYFYLTGDQAEVTNGGKAVFSFNITNAGDYVVETLVNADDESTNSFFVNVDAPPEADMIWDIEVTTGFEKRVIAWRGDGDSATDQFSPKRFKLDPGAHTLVLVGREPGTLLKSVNIRPAPSAAPAPATP
jgi:hypothetical protein